MQKKYMRNHSIICLFVKPKYARMALGHDARNLFMGRNSLLKH